MSEFRKLFIANTTKHNYEFNFRVPGIDRIFMERIPVGGQVKIYKDAEIDVLEYIVNQHQNTPEPFLVPVNEVDRHKGHIGLIYQFDKEISAKQIERKFRENDDALIEKGKAIRIENAVALSAALNDQVAMSNTEVGEVRTEIVEDVKPGESIDRKIAEGVIVEGRRPGRPRKS